MKKNRINGQLARSGHKPSGSRSIKLTDDEGVGLRNLEQAVIDAKCRFFDAYSQLVNAKKLCDDLQVRLLGAARQVLIDHGVNIDDKSQGNWDLDTATMTFNRTQ